MTNEEAIHFANCLKNNYTIDFNDMEEFCDMVIKALEQEPREGHWVPISSPFDSSDVHKCSVCGLQQDGATRFCPDCGADMREGEE